MSQRTYRIYVCTGIHCTQRLPQALSIFERAVRRASNENIQVIASSCLNHCDYGPNALIQPNAILYNQLTQAAIYQIVDQQCDHDQPVPAYLAPTE